MSNILDSIITLTDENNQKEIIDSWQRSGLLEDLCPEMAKYAAFTFEHVAQILIQGVNAEGDILFVEILPHNLYGEQYHWEKSESDCELDTLIFPILRRILSTIEKKSKNYINIIEYIDLNELCKVCKECYITSYPILKSNLYYNQDLEAEFCASFSEDYVNYLLYGHEIKKLTFQ